ncbi:ABC transporter permease [Phycicoccus endophyticus]|uniref:ABC transporter permease n=1 Tax=Phycicoccus endophyticus TaxID=1690220 RepID=A0A7G9R1A4_9MICO|nr:ABC transporter permease [Phycicoccus endophyticus]NHI18846.1 ABC transporter permease [Phycicoccus endophyticus]QNN49379.1 ABC transporter permease [Phycicoccus endophyticus]GGL36075.1 ABC transporter permease [Phycicoccus endophyticus]
MSATETGLEAPAEPTGRTRAWRSAFLTPAGVTGVALMTVVLVLAALSALGLLPHDPAAQDVGRSLLGPSGDAWFGTDQFGRDVFSRVASGLANSLRVAAVSVAVSAAVGITLGVLAGYLQGVVDRLVGVVTNVLFAFPSLLLALALAATLSRSWVTVSVAIAVVYVPIFARVARGPVLSLRTADYVLAAQAVGRSRLSTLVEHVVPNMAGILVVQTTLSLSWAILTEASLSFLGFGTPPPAASLGGMVYDAQALTSVAPWLLVFPGVGLVVAVIGLNLIGDALRSVLDPRAGGR